LRLLDSAMSVFTRLAFRFEFLFPQFIGFYIKRKLSEYKEQDLLSDYKVKSRRLAKHHYLFDLDLFLNIEKGGEIEWLKKIKDMSRLR
jgi:hypothetical protein